MPGCGHAWFNEGFLFPCPGMTQMREAALVSTPYGVQTREEKHERVTVNASRNDSLNARPDW